MMPADDAQVCVIGAGPSGLAAIKYCLEYGFSVTCYDNRPRLGGIWTGSDPSASTDAAEDGSGRRQTSAHSALTLNTSQYITTFSDFPLPADLTPSLRGRGSFLDAADFLVYLDRYARHFRLLEHIRLNSEVLAVRRRAVAEAGAEESAESRPWEVTVRRSEDGKPPVEWTSRHRYVIVASGFYSEAVVPEFPGDKETEVQIIHSAHVRQTRELFEGQRVLVVGGSISAADMVQAAIDGGAAKITWAVSRRPSERSVWMVHRYPFGRRFAYDEWITLFAILYYPKWLRKLFIASLTACVHRRAPDARLDLLKDRLSVVDVERFNSARAGGQLEVAAASLQHFQPGGCEVRLTDGRTVPVDRCVLATGFRVSYPFLGPDVAGPDGVGELQLYRHLVAVRDTAWGLHFLYTSSVTGSGVVVAEIEARYLVHQLAGRRFHSEAQRQALVRSPEALSRPFGLVPLRRPAQETVHELACELGCQPRPWALMLSPWPRRRRLGLAVAFGPWTPQLYRLRGPHACPETAATTVMAHVRLVMGWKFEAAALVLDALHLLLLTALVRFVYRRWR